PWCYPDSTVTYSGIDHADFPVGGAPCPHPWRWRLLFAGRLDARKGPETAIRALGYLPDEATLELSSPVDDMYRLALERIATELGLGHRQKFMTVTRQQLRSRYVDADVCLFPTEWDEPFGLVPVEAMACGTLVVATGR